MKMIKTAVTAASVCCIFLASSPTVPAQEGKVDRVAMKGGKVMVTRGSQTFEIEQPVNLPFDIKVNTNGTFQVKDGRERKLLEGQTLGSDGMLMGADGSIDPVFDHVAMKSGRPFISRDGDVQPLSNDVTLGDGSRVTATGYIVNRQGRPQKLLDGQLFKLDGQAVGTKDTVTLKGGKVMVQKDGSMLEIAPGRSLIMNDGTKVLGDGAVVYRDGNARKLVEGEIITLEGVVRK